MSSSRPSFRFLLLPFFFSFPRFPLPPLFFFNRSERRKRKFVLVPRERSRIEEGAESSGMKQTIAASFFHTSSFMRVSPSSRPIIVSRASARERKRGGGRRRRRRRAGIHPPGAWMSRVVREAKIFRSHFFPDPDGEKDGWRCSISDRFDRTCAHV